MSPVENCGDLSMIDNKKISNGLKIGIYDPYLDDIGGGEKYMMTIAEFLSKSHDVDVFWDEISVIDKISERFGLNLTNVNIANNIFKYPFVKRQKASKKYDIIIFLSDGSIPILSSKKIFIHIQQPILNKKLTIKDKLKLKRISGIFVNSEFTKKFVDRVFGVKSKILFPPVNIYGMHNEKQNIILHVGRFRVIQVSSDDYKKQSVMINVFKKMVDSGLKDWKFVIAVSLPDEFDPKFVAMKNSAKGYPIEFLINSSNESLWKKGAKAKIYWHASGFGEDLEKHPELAEHFGISTVEAMGVGAVPVVINAGGQAEIVQDDKNGLLWESLDEFEKDTFKLINDPKLLKEMSVNAYKRSLDFDKENFYKTIKQILNV